MTAAVDDDLDDILNGVEEIADFTGDDKRRTHYKLENEMLPAYQEGRLWRMRKSTYREFDRRRQEAALERALRKHA